ncbi:MAG: hypothetical protein NVSMB45_01710 [Ginsengibacter sp.]
MKWKLFTASLCIATLASCTKQHEESFLIRNPVVCDTTNVKFSINVFPIIQNRCFSCHGNGLQLGNVSLGTYAAIRFQATQNDLIQVIKHEPGFVQMPLGEPKMSSCEINTIVAWVNNGAPLN